MKHPDKSQPVTKAVEKDHTNCMCTCHYAQNGVWAGKIPCGKCAPPTTEEWEKEFEAFWDMRYPNRKGEQIGALITFIRSLLTSQREAIVKEERERIGRK